MPDNFLNTLNNMGGFNRDVYVKAIDDLKNEINFLKEEAEKAD